MTSRLPFRAVIFDLDGTLADSLADIGEAMNRALARHGFPTHAVDDYRLMVGEGAEVLVRRAMPKGATVPVPQLVDEYRAEYQALEHAKTLIYPGIPELLDGLTARGVPMAVLSNKRDDFTKDLVAKRLGRWRFRDVRGEQPGVPRKPDPTAAFELALALNATPAGIAFVGDSAIDMGTAKNAGMTGVGVLWGFRTREELTAAGAKHVLSRPEELLELR